MADIDVCGIGSALVDILVETDAGIITEFGLVKGSMHLMDVGRSEAIHAKVDEGIHQSGGSCANTIAGVAALGGSTAFIGRVADDPFGFVFDRDMRSLGVILGEGERADPSRWATGRSLILVTPDADRTMCTTLGVAAHLDIDTLDRSLIERSSITYFEGYLWDEPVAIDALRTAIDIAKDAGQRVAMSLSDPFCVDRHRAAWRELIDTRVDLVFGNDAELCSLMETDDLVAACAAVRRPGLVVTVTRGAEGAWAFDGDGPVVSVDAMPTEVVDTTGAGDLYASGFLYGITHGHPLDVCLRLGTATASEAISHIGARPMADLPALVAPIMAAV